MRPLLQHHYSLRCKYSTLACFIYIYWGVGVCNSSLLKAETNFIPAEMLFFTKNAAFAKIFGQLLMS